MSFNQLKDLVKRQQVDYAGIGLVGLLGAIGYGLYKFFEPKIKEVIDKILEFKKKIEDFAKTVKEKVEGFVEGVKERFKEIKNTLIGWYNNITGAINNALGFTGLNIPPIQQEGMSNLGENYKNFEEQAAIQRAQEFRESGEIKDDIPEDSGFFGGIGKAIGDGFNAITGRGAPPSAPNAQPTTPIMGSGSSPASPPKAVADDKPFQRGVSNLAKKYNVSEDDLYAVMSFETGELLIAQKNAAGSGATGLIQFMLKLQKDWEQQLKNLQRCQELNS